jgi:NAD(P)-dependent dehydrogenase (short-subunit alcohol dehydrogenase family)
VAETMEKDVVVIIGVGGMGLAIARRQGQGRTLLLGDIDETPLRDASDALDESGLDVETRRVDVTSRSDLTELAGQASSLGSVVQVVHTAGLSPVQASTEQILSVDLLGVALTLEVFGGVIANTGAGLVISSMAGHLQSPLSSEEEGLLASTPAEELLDLPFARPEKFPIPGMAYPFAKRANHLRVAAASVQWGKRGARINSLSPGIISTSMGRAELESESGPFMQAMVRASAARRLGSVEDIAAAAGFLLGDQAAFITGTDLLVDGGAVAALRSGRVEP